MVASDFNEGHVGLGQHTLVYTPVTEGGEGVQRGVVAHLRKAGLEEPIEISALNRGKLARGVRNLKHRGVVATGLGAVQSDKRVKGTNRAVLRIGRRSKRNGLDALAALYGLGQVDPDDDAVLDAGDVAPAQDTTRVNFSSGVDQRAAAKHGLEVNKAECLVGGENGVLLCTKGVVWFGVEEILKNVGGDRQGFLGGALGEFLDSFGEEIQWAVLARGWAVFVVNTVECSDCRNVLGEAGRGLYPDRGRA